MELHALLDDIGIGHSLGNYFDAIPSTKLDRVYKRAGGKERREGKERKDELYYSTQSCKKEEILSIKEKGFNAVRLTTTWMHHLVDYDTLPAVIQPKWIARINEVVGWIIDEGLYCVINMHRDITHDWQNEIGNLQRNFNERFQTNEGFAFILQQVKDCWRQIAEEFNCFGEKLIFEGFNECMFQTTWNQWDKNNSEDYRRKREKAFTLWGELNQAFVSTVRVAGGNNADRVLIIDTYNAIDRLTDYGDYDVMLQYLPKDTVPNRLVWGTNLYYPSQFTLSYDPNCSWGYMPTWGTEQDKEDLRNYFKLHTTNTPYPVIIIEYGAPIICGEKDPASRDLYIDFVTKLCEENNLPCFYWNHPWYGHDVLEDMTLEQENELRTDREGKRDKIGRRAHEHRGRRRRPRNEAD